MGDYGKLLTTGREGYKSLIFGVNEFHNCDEYIENYEIRTGETLLIYAYQRGFSSFSLEGNGTIITDKAVYFHPSHSDWGRDNRIDLDSICQFVVFQEHPKDSVHLLSREQDICIFGSTVAPMDTTGEELVQLLHHLQRAQMQYRDTYRRQYERVVGWILDVVSSGFHDYGLLTSRHEKLLQMVEADEVLIPTAAMLRGCQLYRLCDLTAYFKYIESVRPKISRGLYQKLMDPDAMYFKDYVADLSSSTSVYFANAMIPAYSRLKGMDRLSVTQCVILCFLSILMNDENFCRELLSVIRDDLDGETFWQIQSFACCYKNEQMVSIYEKIISGEEFTLREKGYTDSVGLTPLHYSLIMRDRTRSLSLLQEEYYGGFHPVFQGEGDIREVFDFLFLSSVLYDDDELNYSVFLHTSPVAKPLLRSIEKLDNLLEINKSLYEKNDSEEYKRRITELTSMRREISGELLRMSHDAIVEARMLAKKLIEVAHPFGNFLLHMYMDSDSVYHALADTVMGWRIYCYEDFYFLAPSDMKLDLSYVEWMDGKIIAKSLKQGDVGFDEGAVDILHLNKTYDNPEYIRAQKAREEEARRRKEERAARAAYEEETWQAYNEAFGDGETSSGNTSEGASASRPFGSYKYFSAEARKSLRVLKREYRVLVKKYHPDSLGDDSGVQILREIMEERADILEQLK